MFSQPIVHAPPLSPPKPLLKTHYCVKCCAISIPIYLQYAQSNSKSQTNPILLLNGEVNSTTYSSILDSCSNLEFGKQMHAHLLKNGFYRREFIGTKLLQLYAKFGCFDDVPLLFEKMPEKNLYTYTALLNMFVDNGLFEEALIYFELLLFEDIELEFFIFPVALKICRGYGGVELGRQLHGITIKVGVSSHIYVGNALIDMYGKCGNSDYAKKFLDRMSERDCVSWNSLITACATNGKLFEALKFLEMMLEENELAPNFVSWSALIGEFLQNGYDEEAIKMLYKMRAEGCKPDARMLQSILPTCARLRKLRLGKEIYGYITRHGFMSSPYIINGLIDLYRKCDDMASAFKIFSSFSMRDEVSFNTIIAGYCDSQEIHKAKELFEKMESEGKSKDLVSWNSMISGYTNNFMFDEALRMLIHLMNKGGIQPNSFTLGSSLGACANLGSLRLGKCIHSNCVVQSLGSNLYVGGALVEMYCRCQDLESAEKALHDVSVRDIAIWSTLVSGYARYNQTGKIQRVLQKMKDDGFEPNVYTWNGIIAGYVENGHYELALKLFSDMWASNLKPDAYTVGIVLPACSKLATIERGKQVHAYTIRCGFESDTYIIACLIDMYSKCGFMGNAKNVNNWSKIHNLVTQNAMLNAYSMHGNGEDGIAFFRKLLVNGLKPDSVTFLSVLSLCVHAGSVDNGKELFDLMGSFGVIPTLKHYTCMVDLLSRAGELKLAYEVLESMPVDPDSIIWGALLGGCIIHGDVELGEVAGEKLIDLEPDNSGNYVMLANLYASTGRWGELEKIRHQMKEEQLSKDPGCSWIEDKDEMHVFMAFDTSHKRTNEIYDILDNLATEMRSEYV